MCSKVFDIAVSSDGIQSGLDIIFCNLGLWFWLVFLLVVFFVNK